MSTTPDFANFILDCINDDSASVYRMFGEYALYFDKKVVGFICDNKLFLKITNNSEKFNDVESLKLKREPAYPGSKDYFIAPDELLENGRLLKKIILEIWEDVPQKKKVGKKK
jgi:TfoX/Sxy family transcriptional regulator of competence genes